MKNNKKISQFRYIFHGMSIKHKFYTIFIIQMIILLVWYLYMLNISISDNKKNIMNTAQQLNHKVVSSLNTDILCMENISTFPVIRGTTGELSFIYTYLSENNPDKYNPFEYYIYVDKQINQLFNMYYSIIDQVYIFDMKGNAIGRNVQQQYYVNIQYNMKSSWVNDVISAYGKPVLLNPSEIQDVDSVVKDNHIYLARAIINAETYKPIGIILVSSDINDVINNFQSSGDFTEQNFGLYTFDGKLLLGNPVIEKSDVMNISNDTNKSNVSSNSDIKKYENRNWMVDYNINKGSKIISIIKLPLATKNLKLRQYGFWGMIAILFISSLAIMTLILRSILNPIEALVKACSSISKGNFNIAVPTDEAFEIKELSSAFTNMAKKIDFLINEVYARNIAERDLELQMLRSQINPHFLYNTLESMRMVAYLNNDGNLGEMCVLLAKTLRYGVTAPNEEVTVKDEVDNLNDYIKLQKLLYSDHFDFTVNIEEVLMGKHIIKLIIQPLVENSIYHGLASITDKGRIFVLGYTENEDMIFKIIDNGNGMDKTTLELLNDYIQGKNNQFKSIGLKNVHRRIQLYYGEQYGMSIESCPGKGTSVTITLPLKEDKGGETLCITS